MAKAKGSYVGVIDEGSAMFFDAPSGSPIQATVCAAVAFVQGKDKRVVQRGKRYRKGEEPKGLQATATRMATKWNGYLARTGKRFELEQDAKNEKKAAIEKAARLRRERGRLRAGDMEKLLATIVGHWDFTALLEKETTGDRLVQAARQARELLNFIENGESN